MRRIKLAVALAAAMVVLVMAAAPAMASVSVGNNHGSNSIGSVNLGGFSAFSLSSGLGTSPSFSIDGGAGFDSVDFN